MTRAYSYASWARLVRDQLLAVLSLMELISDRWLKGQWMTHVRADEAALQAISPGEGVLAMSDQFKMETR